MTAETHPIPAAELADLAAHYAIDKKAIDVVTLDLRGVAGFADFFVIATGNTDRQVKAIHDSIHYGMKKEHGLLPRRVEGVQEARWILMDYWDIDVHIFTPDMREFYRLEQLWGDVVRIPLDPALLGTGPEAEAVVDVDNDGLDPD